MPSTLLIALQELFFPQIIKPLLWSLAKSCLKTLEQRRKHDKAILMDKCRNNEVEGIDNNFLRHMDSHNN